MIKKTVILLVGAVLIVSVLASGCTFNVGNYDSDNDNVYKYERLFDCLPVGLGQT